MDRPDLNGDRSRAAQLAAERRPTGRARRGGLGGEALRPAGGRQLEHARRRRRHRADCSRTFAGRLGPVVPVVFLIQEAYREGPEVPTKLDGSASFASLIRSLRPDGSREEMESIARRLGLHAYYVPSMRNGGPGCFCRRSRQRHPLHAAARRSRRDRAAVRAPAARRRCRDRGGRRQRPGRHGGSAWCRRISTTWSARDGCGSPAASSAGPARPAASFRRSQDERSLVLGGDLNTWFGFRDSAYPRRRRAFRRTQVSDRRATFHGLLRLDHLFFRLDEGWRRGSSAPTTPTAPITIPLIGEIAFQ